jgi:pilus assembly protein FimV
MIAKRSSRALALLLALPSAAFALGLGDIRLLSPLNSPLDAEIELVDVAPDEANTVQAQLASRETFARYGLDWPGFLAGVQVRTAHTSDGRTLVKLKSTDPISEPFITLLVEVNWSRGRLVREYTMLLDPPVYTPGGSSVASAPVSAPSTGSGTREGAIARSAGSAPSSAPAAATAAPSLVSTPPSAATAPPAASGAHTTAASPGEASTHVVRRGETLSHIAAAAAGESANTPRARSWMLAIYQGNPQAFEQNMNLLRTGAVLRMPDAATVNAVSPGEALTEIRRQTAAWRSASGNTPAAAAEQPGRLKLVTPSESPAAGAMPGGTSAEVKGLQGRVHDLEGQLAEQKRLLALKDADLARLQAQLAAKQAPPPPAQPPATQPSAAQPQAPATPPARQPEATAAAPPATPPPVPATSPAAPEEKATASAQPSPAAPKTATHPAPARPQPSAGGSLVDTIKDYWWAVLVVLLGLVALALTRIMRSRRASEFDDSLGRLAVAGAGSASPAPDFGSGGGGRFGPVETPARSAAPAAAPEATFLVEESGSHERVGLGAVAPPAPAPRHVASDDTISSETAINLDQGDPLAEADFHMAYGLYDQAADLIRIAISREPARRDLKLKLLEVFFVWGNKEQFLQTARELAETRASAAPGEWEKILIMGKQLAPEDPLFSGAAAVSGATAGGVDLDLEGGQSRVDFDLLGEPVAGEAGQAVDLDIGAAVGDLTTESTTNVTDRNSALFQGGSATATTRQMTQHVHESGATAEMEGPTVEQPAIGSPENATLRQKVETVLRQGGAEQTAELAIDDLGLDVGPIDTVDQPGPASAARSSPDSPTLLAGFDEHPHEPGEDAQTRELTREMTREIPPPPGTSSTGAWQFDETELEQALTQTSLAPEISNTSRLAALKGQEIDVDLGDATSSLKAPIGDVDLDVGSASGAHPGGNGALDLDVGEASVPEAAFGATQRLSSDELALPDLEPVTMSEVGTKLDLARAYMDMGDPDGARNILEEVLNEGSAAQKQEAQRLMESLPG